ncbi:glycosyltransferase family 4 protein [Corynebacterium afermentans]|uniref:glycosyltransferase family 4 protein n=1 Tax=Corynebacterium afermentans TaxID=38286 RepID=UPI002572B0EA|nr:glycosyltransferase family 4 protein [Corynebacterium afermentans]MDC7109706.1 glycosyltransferase family 4 protein [Corynebacterium afermentans]
MGKRRILMPVRTVAEWGGVHEWTVDAAAALIHAGHEVTFVGSGEVFKERAEATGASFHVVNWSKGWKSAARSVGEQADFDLIFSHAPAGRQFGLLVNEQAKKEHVVMVHGAYHDYMYEWSDQVDAFVAASPSLVHFVQQFGRVAPWKVTNLPNAAPNEAFDLPLLSHDQKLEEGVGHIVTASRLSKDKVVQIDSVEAAVRSLASLYPDVQWEIDVCGDGPLRDYFDKRYNLLGMSVPNVSHTMHGWVEPAEIPLVMNRAYLTVAAGMAGMRALASGSLLLGTGARASVGVQTGNNLRAGIWSNFGDHGIFRFSPTEIQRSLEALANPERYDEAVEIGRMVVAKGNTQSVVDDKMRAALQCG